MARRVLQAWQDSDAAAMTNLFSSDDALRVLGFDVDEWWMGPAGFLKVWQTQVGEMPDWTIDVQDAEAFEEGGIGWATLFSTINTPEAQTSMRHTAVLRLEAGAWKVIHWHNSIPVPNQRIFGVSLTTTLDDLVASVLDDSHLKVGASSEGTMTLVFTDIVDSTTLAQSVGDFAWAEMIKEHESTIQRLTASEGGNVVKFLGDGSMLAFESARAAVRTAVEIQRASADRAFAVRIGIHSGEVVRTSDDLFGLTVNKAARVAAAADADGIMASSTTRDLVGSMDGMQVGESRLVALKGLPDTHQLFPIEWT